MPTKRELRQLKPLDVEEMEEALDDYLAFEEVVPDILEIEGIASPYRIYRYDKGADRFYFLKINDGDSLNPVMSVTSYTQKILNNAHVLMKWQDNVGGYDIANYIKNMRAEYGTFMHITFKEILMTGVYDFDKIKRDAWSTAFGLGYKMEAMQWVEDIVDDVVGFIVFLIEREVEVVALEFPIGDIEIGLGGCIDMVCNMKFGTKKVKAIVDFKSGRKGFFEGHELQLGLYKVLWNKLYSQIFEVTHVFNFAPSGSFNKEKYKLKNQTDSRLVLGAELEAGLCRSRGYLDGVKTSHFAIKGSGEWKSFKLQEHIIEYKI